MARPFLNGGGHDATVAMVTKNTVPMVVAPEMATAMVTGPLPGSVVPSNAHSVNYFDENRQVYDSVFSLLPSKSWK